MHIDISVSLRNTAPMENPIKRYRTTNKLTQEQFAKMVGCDTSTIANIERGARGISDELKTNIVTATGGEITLQQLFNWVLKRKKAA